MTGQRKLTLERARQLDAALRLRNERHETYARIAFLLGYETSLAAQGRYLVQQALARREEIAQFMSGAGVIPLIEKTPAEREAELMAKLKAEGERFFANKG